MTMTTDLDAFLAKITENLDDRGPQAALADYLHDHPELIAEVIGRLLRWATLAERERTLGILADLRRIANGVGIGVLGRVQRAVEEGIHGAPQVSGRGPLVATHEGRPVDPRENRSRRGR